MVVADRKLMFRDIVDILKILHEKGLFEMVTALKLKVNKKNNELMIPSAVWSCSSEIMIISCGM